MIEALYMLDKHIDPKALAEKWGEAELKPVSPQKPKGKMSMTLPPPNVTGTLHIGHALTYTLQDVWIRYWRMQGYDVLAQPGLDHAGIATQMMVEKHLATQNIRREDLGRSGFLQESFAFKEKTGSAIVAQMKRLGVAAHWDRLMFTLDEPVQEAVRKVFVRLFDEGLIYQSERLVHWDTHFQTALSNLEVQNKETKGTLWTIRYHLENNATQFIDVATTRPETLFGDQAVAVHTDDPRYQHLLGQKVRLPLTDRSIPVIADERVEREKGTGALKITPAHDFIDFEVGKTHNLNALSILDERGYLNDHVPETFRGLSVKEGRQKVLDALSDQGLLIEETPIDHTIPFGDRSQTPLEPRLTKQWFLDVKPLANKALKALQDKEFVFFPEHYANTYIHWLETIEPWCLSRQLWWGHAIPAWYGPDGTVFVATSEESAQNKASAHYGKSVPLRRDDDVLDTWFSSALWPFVTLGWPNDTEDIKTYYPTSTLVTGFDIIFFWVARMVMMGVHLTGQVPFGQVYIHGLVRDETRQKMSKTKGNVINPLEVIDIYGVDALRLSLATLSTPGRDIAFGMHHVEISRNFLTKLWNATRFSLTQNIHWPTETPSSPNHPLNQWLLEKIHDAGLMYETAMNAGKFYEGVSVAYHFVWDTYCDQYIEMSKILLADNDETLVQEIQETAGYALGISLQMLYPFAPITATELWSHLAPNNAPLYQTEWAHPKKENTLSEGPQEIDIILIWAEEMRRIRSVFQISHKTSLTVHTKAPEIILRHKTFLETFVHINIQPLEADQNKPGIHGAVKTVPYFIPLSGVLDLEATKTLLKKRQAKIMLEKEKLAHKMALPQFKDKAPPEVIMDTEAKMLDLKNQEAIFEDMISRMKV